MTSKGAMGRRAARLPDAGAIVCVNDKWDEKEVEKGHKLVDAVQRCVIIPNDPAAPKFVYDCVGKYNIGKDKRYESWEEGSHLKEYPYKITGGTGKYEGVTGAGTYVYENLSDTIAGGTYKGTVTTP